MTQQSTASSDRPSPAGASHPAWARAMTSQEDFLSEQEKLGHLWTFLGFASDIPANNDWFRTTLGGRSIFVQRFEKDIRAYLNRCAHRYYPLRTSAHGNGPIVCGFHHWRYNRDGLAIGIPNCQEMFGKTPREMNQQLPEVEIAQCGSMIFGRFPAGGQYPNPSLEDWLGDGYAILNHLTNTPPPAINRLQSDVAANWRLLMQISLDDYHLVAVHPSTFGKSGYLKPEKTRYFRFGAHSAYIASAPDDALAKMAEACRAANYTPESYRILQFFPNLIVAMIRAVNYLGDRYWFLLVQQLVPEAYDRTRSVTRFTLLPFAKPAGVLHRQARTIAKPWVTLGFAHYARKTHREDNQVVEQLQRSASLFEADPVRALQEQRVSWFEEEYQSIIER
jgi:phenylpropionate dioxygenase-like ring-hydroxylating dioxygenase large terminal subunit